MQFIVIPVVFVLAWFFWFRDTPDEKAENLNGKIVFANHLDDSDKEKVVRVLDYIKQNQCDELVRYETSILSINADYRAGSSIYGYQKDRYGWEEEVELKINISDKPAIGLSEAAGHSLYFDIGAGNQSGIIAKKDVGMHLCGFASHLAGTGADKFGADPALKQVFDQ
jgi:hypothetical protein